MKEFKPGDKVWDPRYGNGFVQEKSYTDEHTNPDCIYPVSVYFIDYGRQKERKKIYYKEDGREHSNAAHPTLFHGHDLILKPVAPKQVWVNIYWNPDEACFFFGNMYAFSEEYAKKQGKVLAGYIKTIELILPEDV